MDAPVLTEFLPFESVADAFPDLQLDLSPSGEQATLCSILGDSQNLRRAPSSTHATALAQHANTAFPRDTNSRPPVDSSTAVSIPTSLMPAVAARSTILVAHKLLTSRFPGRKGQRQAIIFRSRFATITRSLPPEVRLPKRNVRHIRGLPRRLPRKSHSVNEEATISNRLLRATCSFRQVRLRGLLPTIPKNTHAALPVKSSIITDYSSPPRQPLLEWKATVTNRPTTTLHSPLQTRVFPRRKVTMAKHLARPWTPVPMSTGPPKQSVGPGDLEPEDDVVYLDSRPTKPAAVCQLPDVIFVRSRKRLAPLEEDHSRKKQKIGTGLAVL